MSNRKRRDDWDDFDVLPPEDDAPDSRESRRGDVRSSAQEAVRRAGARGKGRGRGRGKGPGSPFTDQPLLLIGAVVIGLAILGFVAYSLIKSSNETAPQQTAQQPTRQDQPGAQRPVQPATQPTPAQPADSSESVIPGLTGSAGTANYPEQSESWLATVARVLLRLAAAALLAALLAFRPRKDMPGLQKNPYVAQTQILLAVVASALMMVVADNAARAFGIFAAASLVRFRTNIRDPKETTVLLISLAIGLGTGVGKWELAVVLTLFVLLMLWVLEYYEPAQIFRSLELTVTTRNVEETDEILKEIFEKHDFMAELRKVDREDEDNPLGKIVYHVNVSPEVSTDQMSEEIFSNDSANVDAIQWDQKKSTSYNYR